MKSLAHGFIHEASLCIEAHFCRTRKAIEIVPVNAAQVAFGFHVQQDGFYNGIGKVPAQKVMGQPWVQTAQGAVVGGFPQLQQVADVMQQAGRDQAVALFVLYGKLSAVQGMVEIADLVTATGISHFVKQLEYLIDYVFHFPFQFCKCTASIETEYDSNISIRRGCFAGQFQGQQGGYEQEDTGPPQAGLEAAYLVGPSREQGPGEAPCSVGHVVETYVQCHLVVTGKGQYQVGVHG